MYFHAPKCTFNTDPIWEKKWNYVDVYLCLYYILGIRFQESLLDSLYHVNMVECLPEDIYKTSY